VPRQSGPWRETDIFSDQYRGAIGISNGLLLLFCVFVFGYFFFSPSLATPAYPQDTFFILSDGWRFANGQVPYRDYYSPLGPLSGLMTGLGMLLRHPGSGLAHSVLVGEGLMLAILLPISIFVAYRRLGAPMGALFCFLIVSIMATRVAFGDPATSHLTITGTYNNQGYTLLTLFALQTLLPARGGSHGAQIADDILAGIVLLLLFFDKLNYFGAGVAVLAVAIVTPLLLPPGRSLGLSLPSAMRCCVAFVILTALILSVFGISPLKIAADTARLLQAQSVFVTPAERMARVPKVVFDVFRQYTVLLFGFPILLRYVYGRLPQRQELVLLALGLFLTALSVGMILANLLQEADLFLILLLAFLWVEAFARSGAPAPAFGAMLVSAILVLTVLQHQAVAVLSTVRAAAVEFRAGKTPNRWLAGTELKDLAIPPNEGAVNLMSASSLDWSVLRDARQVDSLIGGDFSMYELSQIVSEGECLFLNNSSSGDRVFTDWTYDIFSLLRPQPPYRGGTLGYGPGFDITITPEYARSVLTDATLIMVPRANLLSAIVTPAAPGLMASNFAKVGESHYWTLWRRKGSSDPGPHGTCPSAGNPPA
jgi:hypothetical protein